MTKLDHINFEKNVYTLKEVMNLDNYLMNKWTPLLHKQEKQTKSKYDVNTKKRLLLWFFPNSFYINVLGGSVPSYF